MREVPRGLPYASRQKLELELDKLLKINRIARTCEQSLCIFSSVIV